MSHCHDEHAGHGGHHHDHEHDHSDDITPALQHSLYQRIEFDAIDTMNECITGSGKAVVKKTWAERLQVEPELASDVDEQLLVTVPFTGQVKLHSILLRTSPSSSAPRTLRLFINRQDIDFESADTLKPTQTLELSQTSEVQEIPVKRALFHNVQRLTMFFPDNFASTPNDDASETSDDDSSDDEVATRISYIGFKGEWMQLGRAPTNIIYEAAPNPNDHKLKNRGENQAHGSIGG